MNASWPLAVGTAVCAVILVGPCAVLAQTPGGPPAAVPTAAADAPSGRGDAVVLERKISLHLDRVPLKRAIDAIGAAAHVRIAYSSTHVPLNKIVTLVIDSITVGDALTVLLRGTRIGVTVSPGGALMLDEADAGPRVLALTPASATRTDSGSVAGTVTDSATGAVVPYVIVRIEETGQTATTSANGKYVIPSVVAATYRVTFRRVGFFVRTLSVAVVGGKVSTLDATVARQATKLDEMVTTATGQQRRYEVGNDITTLSADSVLSIAPISTFTDMIATRVPGLIVQNTTGIPGAPSRLRLRGVSSIEQSDDPIVIVDGVRVYSNQSGTIDANGNVSNGGSLVIGRVGNPNGGSSNTFGNYTGYAGPSAIDQIDPNSIATIEVMKGPSASALYGSDAANGVIIITTKRGVAGTTRWNLTLDGGINTEPGNWPINYYRFGHATGLNNAGSQPCSIYSGPTACTTDSIVAFQALNNPRLSPLGTGWTDDASLGVSGGAGPVTFAANGTYGNETGTLHLPGYEVQRFDKYHGFPAPGWMVDPDQLGRWGASTSLSIALDHSHTTLLTLTSSLYHSAQQQSSLQTAVSELATEYIDSTVLASNPLISEYYERAQLTTLTTTNALTLSNWMVLPWLPITATLGLSTSNTYNTALTPAGYIIGTQDSVGNYAVAQGQNMVETINVGTVVRWRWLSLATGFNVQSTSNQTLSASTKGLPIGVSVPSSFNCVGACVSLLTQSAATYGWYVQPGLTLTDRLFVNPGFRLDGGTASGSNAQASFYPKIDGSYIAIDRRNNSGVPWITLLRPRLAFGIAGVQPGPGEKLRLYSSGTVASLDSATSGQSIDIVELNSLGNTKLVPERSRETEGGVDANLLDDRVALTATGYYKMRYDAIISVPVAPSVGGGSLANPTGSLSQERNIGTVRNEGIEATVTVIPVETRSFTWSVNALLTKNVNSVVNLVPGQGPLVLAGGMGYENIIKPGYPLGGFWAKPILSYYDANHDGIIEPGEVRVGDSAVFIGSADPKYQLSFSTTLTFLRRLSVNAGFDYQNGLTQVNANAPLLLDINNPRTPPQSLQAAVAAYLGGETAYGLVQTVSVLRFNTLSVNYALPPSISRFFRVPSMSIALQGRNLALFTNYRGKDPAVNAYSSGNLTADTGQLPPTRTYALHITMGN
jgi:TonB-dependent SusC/RagA subfamily outer membrane receptor